MPRAPASSTKKSAARSPSPAKPKAAPKVSKSAKKSSPKKAAVPSPKIVESEEDEEITSEEEEDDEIADGLDSTYVADSDDDEADNMLDAFEEWIFEQNIETKWIKMVVRVQYIQCYLFAAVLLLNSIGVPQVPTLPLFEGASSLTKGVAASLGMAQAFSFTASAQSDFIAMKKMLQYNMIFHLTFAAMLIMHSKEVKEPHLVQATVVGSLLNVGLEMWVCYFKDPFPAEDEDEE